MATYFLAGKQVLFYTKRDGSSAATSFGVYLHLLLKVYLTCKCEPNTILYVVSRNSYLVGP